MLITDLIAEMINKMLTENDGECEFQRSDLANIYGCVPSQINYVITSRFTPEKGYIVESRRGGGGYIRIQRIKFDKRTYAMHFLNTVGDTVDAGLARALIVNLFDHEIISEREMMMLANITGDNVLKNITNAEERGSVRAYLLKQAVLPLI